MGQLLYMSPLEGAVLCPSAGHLQSLVGVTTPQPPRGDQLPKVPLSHPLSMPRGSRKGGMSPSKGWWGEAVGQEGGSRMGCLGTLA